MDYVTTTFISESEKIAYDEAGCKDITLEEFSRNRQNEEINAALVFKTYKRSLKSIKERLVETVSSLYFNKDDCVTRTIIIDGASIMRGGSPYRNKKEGASKNIPDVAALLSVIRFFVARNFEVFAVLSREYLKPNATDFKEGIEELVKNHICVVVPHTNFDYSVALEFAAQTNGVILTSGSAEDQRTDEHCLRVEWGKIMKNRHLRSKNWESDYIPPRKFLFKSEDDKEMTENDVIQRVYAFPSQLQYSISKQQQKMVNPQGKKRKVLTILDDLIVQGIAKYKKNVKNILGSPSNVPIEPTSASKSVDSDEDEW